MSGFPITAVHQLELTSRCNLRCRYCPSPHLPRAKIDMSPEVFERALGWAAHYVRAGTQFELNLAGIGESTMHPRFVEWVGTARELLGPQVALTMATNGLLITEEMVAALAPYRPMIWVSLHRPEKAGPAVEILKKYGLLSGVSADPSLASIDWAGQVDWHVSAKRTPCPWVRGGRVFVMADGAISACCLDAAASGIVGSVWDDVTKLRTRPYSLCAGCHHDVGVPLEQEAAA
jgi:hypothetical protein